ncbi:hypothetical protein L1887_27972 [Cichorium endivia]|nr:hypothetical protein L1887_27972 [Cichorium endivia]
MKYLYLHPLLFLLLSDRSLKVFDMFDAKDNGIPGFEESAPTISFEVPAPPIPTLDSNAIINEKLIEYSFEYHDIKQQGFIETNTVKRMVMSSLAKSGLPLSDDVIDRFSDDVIENSSDKTLKEDNIKHDGKIGKEEWRRIMLQYPTLLHYAISSFPLHVLDMIGSKDNGILVFEESNPAKSIAHPNATIDDKIEFSFQYYDHLQQGFIDRNLVKMKLMSILAAPGWPTSGNAIEKVSDEIIDAISDQTLDEANIKHVGKINKEEWKRLMLDYPILMETMTLRIWTNQITK